MRASWAPSAASADPMERLRRADGVWSRAVQDRAVLYSWDDGKAIVLNPTGSVLWEALASPRSAGELVQELIRRFPGLPPDRARTDVDAFLNRLRDESVVLPVS